MTRVFLDRSRALTWSSEERGQPPLQPHYPLWFNVFIKGCGTNTPRYRSHTPIFRNPRVFAQWWKKSRLWRPFGKGCGLGVFSKGVLKQPLSWVVYAGGIFFTYVVCWMFRTFSHQEKLANIVPTPPPKNGTKNQVLWVAKVTSWEDLFFRGLPESCKEKSREMNFRLMQETTSTSLPKVSLVKLPENAEQKKSSPTSSNFKTPHFFSSCPNNLQQGKPTGSQPEIVPTWLEFNSTRSQKWSGDSLANELRRKAPNEEKSRESARRWNLLLVLVAFKMGNLGEFGAVSWNMGEFGGLFPETWVRSLFFVLYMEVAKNEFKIRWGAGYQKLSVLGGWILFKPLDFFEDGQNY